MPLYILAFEHPVIICDHMSYQTYLL